MYVGWVRSMCVGGEGASIIIIIIKVFLQRKILSLVCLFIIISLNDFDIAVMHFLHVFLFVVFVINKPW